MQACYRLVTISPITEYHLLPAGNVTLWYPVPGVEEDGMSLWFGAGPGPEVSGQGLSARGCSQRR